MRATSFLILAACLAACDDDDSPSSLDAAIEEDTSMKTDAEVDAADAEADAADAEVDAADAEADAADAEADAADAEVDAADAEIDAEIDAADAEIDAEVDAADVEIDAEVDAEIVNCDPVEGNLLENGGFEDWSGGLPVASYGSKSDVGEAYVVQQTPGYCGRYAVELQNEGSSHKRFTTSDLSLKSGHYTLKYYAKGQGQIRSGRFSDSDNNNYRYSSYTDVHSDDWQEITHSFNVPGDGLVQVVFSFHSTNGLFIDEVSLVRQPEACDEIRCNEWESCNNTTPNCRLLAGRCNSGSESNEWEDCDETQHSCVHKADRCSSHCDCGEAGKKCDFDSHSCISGDACDGVSCEAWQSCDSVCGVCRLAEDRCHKTSDCKGELPACDTSVYRCVEATSEVNVIPNGGFENWDMYDIPYYGEHLMLDDWYGLEFYNGNSVDTRFASEIDPSLVSRSTDARSGTYALRIAQHQRPADRLTSEGFEIPNGSYSCAYYVRGKGSVRLHKFSSAGEEPWMPWVDYDTNEWQRVEFDIRSNVKNMRIIIYADSPEDGYIEIDDMVCTRNQ